MKQLLLFIILLIFVTSPEVAAQKRKAERAYSSFNAGEYLMLLISLKMHIRKQKNQIKTQGQNWYL